MYGSVLYLSIPLFGCSPFFTQSYATPIFVILMLTITCMLQTGNAVLVASVNTSMLLIGAAVAPMYLSLMIGAACR